MLDELQNIIIENTKNNLTSSAIPDILYINIY